MIDMRIFFLFITNFFLTLSFLGTVWMSPQRYEAIFNFGDSFSDTGNYLAIGAPSFYVVGKLPYGETFFKHPTGRCTDGRLIIDFLAEAFGLPRLPPYLGLSRGQNIQQGVNFAVAGATALDPKFFEDQGLGSSLWTNDSLSVQLGWFKKIKSSLCASKQDCSNYFKKTLFLVGIGGNDYNFPLFAGESIQQFLPSVPLVVEAIAQATSMLIEEGAVELMISGILPFGCCPAFLTMFSSTNNTDYDERTGCLKTLNVFSDYYNNQLKLALEKLRQRYPHASIVYADYYQSTVRFYLAPQNFGFKNGALRVCCGEGGQYNFNDSARCGYPGFTNCEDPSTYVNWDGIHLTEAAYRLIALDLINFDQHLSPFIALSGRLEVA